MTAQQPRGVHPQGPKQTYWRFTTRSRITECRMTPERLVKYFWKDGTAPTKRVNFLISKTLVKNSSALRCSRETQHKMNYVNTLPCDFSNEHANKVFVPKLPRAVHDVLTCP